MKTVKVVLHAFRPLFFMLIGVLLLGACSTGTQESVPTSIPTYVPAPTVRAQASENAVRVGVLATRSAVATQAEYGLILTYLEETLGRPFAFVPITQEEQFIQVEQSNLDFVFSNPLAAVQLRRLYGTKFLATLSYVDTGPEFSAQVIVRKDSGIETLEDLQGKRGACAVLGAAAAGCDFQVYELIQRGIDPYKDFSSIVEITSKDNIVLSVLNKTVDVGFICTRQLKRMVADGMLLNLDDIRVLDQAQDDFVYPHTTDIYPQWPFAALAKTDPALTEAVRQALLAIPADHPAMTNIKAIGFVPAMDYSSLDVLIETLNLHSWDAGQ